MTNRAHILAVLAAACTPTTTPVPQQPLPDDFEGWSTIDVVDAAPLLEELQVIDARPRAAYTDGHLPGAFHLDGSTLRGEVDGVGGQARPLAEAASLFETAGIDPTRPTMVYGSENDTTTARTLWSLAFYGAEGALRLLDGGVDSWEQEGLELTATPPPIDPSTWATEVEAHLRVDQDWVAAHLDDPEVVFFDVRSPDEYAIGHIPGARNVEWTQNLMADGRFVPHAETLALHGDPTQATVVVYCQSGARASVSWALLTFADAQVRLYDGSWNEWGSDPDTPKVTGPNP